MALRSAQGSGRKFASNPREQPLRFVQPRLRSYSLLPVLFGRNWEVDVKRGTFADYAGDFYPPSVLLDDTVYGGKAKAGPFACSFRREKRFKHAREMLRSNAASRVANGQTDVWSVRRSQVALHVLLVDAHNRSRETELSAVRHGFARVHGQVADELFDQSGV